MNQNICSICGANYEYRNGRWICPACGAYKIEELSGEEVTLLYNAAQKLRFSDFDEAEKAYADIIEKYPQNPEGYWGRLLSKYGIKYEEDFDGRKIPTCYATSIESVMSDRDYAKAISLADEDTKAYYQKQADYIERVRKEWVEKAQKENPYDVFICYKDSDLANGIDRTQDSVAAQELYIHLTEQGYRVFFSRESLRGKVGEKYEPYIFNALSTAKVMLVYGSSSEYIMSTWLKNEWHRYYKKIALGAKHPESLLIACDGFSPNELPTILSSKQCFDATRKTFFLDIDKHISRIIQESETVKAPRAKVKEAVLSGLHEHKYKTEVIKASCIAKGYTLHKCDCGYEYRDSYTPLVDHKFKIVNETSPTCVKGGRKEKVCEVCGERVNDNLPALGHTFSKWVETDHPTCTVPGAEQRECIRCGKKETRAIEKLEHTYVANVGSRRSNVEYCLHCGLPKAATLLSRYDVDDEEIMQSVDRTGNRTIHIGDIFKIWLKYWKTFFTNETTKVQKIQHFSGLVFLCSFIFAFAWSCISEGVRTNGVVDTIALVIFIVSSIVSVGTSIARLVEIILCKINRIPLPRNNYSRTWLKVIEGGLWGMSLSFFAMSATFKSTDKVFSYMGMLIFGIWAVITMIYAHCPRQYKNIRFASKLSSIMEKKNLLLYGIAATVIFLVVFALIASVIDAGSNREDQYNTMLSLVESEENEEAYILCKKLKGYQDANQIAEGLYPKILQEAELIYLAGNASGAASLLKRCDIDEKYQDYLYVANGEYNKTSLSNIVIPNGTTHIASEAFRNNTKLTSVTIPDSVIDIGDFAFFSCTNLTSVNIGNGVMSIGNGAFFACYSLGSIVIGNSVTTIGDDAFEGCCIENITIPDSVVSIGDMAFRHCDKLENVIIPNSVTSIGSEAFSSCISLETITIPESVVSIGDKAFRCCDSLESITIPGSVVSIGNSVFSDCESLTNVTILTGVTSIGSEAFSSCISLETITIPESVVSIGNSAFSFCVSLTNVTIPTNVTSIGDYAFYRCNNLESITLPKALMNIGFEAFFNCTNLTSIRYCGTEDQWSEIDKAVQWDIYGPDLNMEYFKIPYTITYNYENE